MPPAFEIRPVTTVTPELVEAFARLLPQLAPGAPPVTARHLQAVVTAPGVHLLVARAPGAGGPIVGTLTLTLAPVPSGWHATVEDVVVDAGARGLGAGTALLAAAAHRARAAGATALDLTSRPARAAANRLYRRLGFVPRETNVYRLALADDAASGEADAPAQQEHHPA